MLFFFGFGWNRINTVFSSEYKLFDKWSLVDKNLSKNMGSSFWMVIKLRITDPAQILHSVYWGPEMWHGWLVAGPGLGPSQLTPDIFFCYTMCLCVVLSSSPLLTKYRLLWVGSPNTFCFPIIPLQEPATHVFSGMPWAPAVSAINMSTAARRLYPGKETSQRPQGHT